MDWRDQGTLIAVRRHGETAAIIEVFTASHGRHVGVVRGGGGRRMAPVLQPGAQLDLTWRARLDAHIGAFTVEPLRDRAAGLLADRVALAGLSSVCALLHVALPEREPHPDLYDISLALFDGLGTDGWALDYLRWEQRLLDELGFGLDLSRCAVNGTRDDLAYVSPKSGRAVSRAGAGDWADRLFPLPACLLGQGPADAADLARGLRITGHFLAQGLEPVLGDRGLPAARARLVAALARDQASP